MSLSEVILYCLLQSLMMLRELEKKWNMSGGRRDIFIWTSPNRLELSLFFTVLIFFQISSFQVLHLPFVSLVPPWSLFITAERRCSWTEIWVVSVQPMSHVKFTEMGRGTFLRSACWLCLD